jgi:hypothetical protein
MNRINVLAIDRDSSRTSSANFEIDAELKTNVDEFLKETGYRKYFVEAEIDEEWDDLTDLERTFITDAELESDFI